MPTAIKTTKTREVVTTVEDEVVELTLSVEEAGVLLAAIGQNTGLLSNDGPRRHNDAIYRALAAIPGVERESWNTHATGTVRLEKKPRDSHPF